MKNVTFIFSDNSNPAFQKGLHDMPVFTDDCRFAMEGSLKDKTFIFNYDDVDGINVRNILEYLESIDRPTSHFKYNFLQFVGFMKHSYEHFMNIYAIMQVQTKNELKVKVILPRNLVLPDYPSLRKTQIEARKEVVYNIDCLKHDLAMTMRLDVDNIEIYVYPRLPSSLVFDKEPIAKTEYFQPKPDLEQYKHNTGETNMQTQNYSNPTFNNIKPHQLLLINLDIPVLESSSKNLTESIVSSKFSDVAMKAAYYTVVNIAMEVASILSQLRNQLKSCSDLEKRTLFVLPNTPDAVMVKGFAHVFGHLDFNFIEMPMHVNHVAHLLNEADKSDLVCFSSLTLLNPMRAYQPNMFNAAPPNPFVNPFHGAFNGMAMDVGRMASMEVWQQQARAAVNNGVNLNNISCACGMLKGIHKHGAICPACSTKVLPTNI